MKLIIVFITILFSSHTLFSQGIEFYKGSFEEAIELAKQQEKLIFIDAYTTWCGPCKRMKKYIFPNKKAGDFYNKYFINMAIDMESQMGRAFNLKYPVRAYPTFLFIDHEGKIVMTDVGGKPMELFIMMGEAALKADDRTEAYGLEYENGNRNFDFMLKYVKALNRVEKSSTKIVYDYINNGPGLSEEEKAKFIFEATSSCDSRLFEMMTERDTKKMILKLYSSEAYENKVYESCWATVKKGMEFNVQDLYEEAKKKYKKELKKKYPKFELEVDLAVAKRGQDEASYLKSAKKYVRLLEDSNSKNEFLIQMRDLFPADLQIAEFAEKTSRGILKEDNSIENNMNYAKMLLKNKKYAEAIPYLDIAIEKSKNDNKLDILPQLEQLKSRTQNMLKK